MRSHTPFYDAPTYLTLSKSMPQFMRSQIFVLLRSFNEILNIGHSDLYLSKLVTMFPVLTSYQI